MIISVPKEIFPGETRVAMTPETVRAFAEKGIGVRIEKGAGICSGFADRDYAATGAVMTTRDEIWQEKGLILKIRAPLPEECGFLRTGQIIVADFTGVSWLSAFIAKKLTCFALEKIPRLSRAQSMDILSSQSNLAGYKAVLNAAVRLQKTIPLMMTAAATLAPVRVLVLGVGVAGLQAIATAKRLGAQVFASDVRPETQEQIVSLGGRFVATDKISAQLSQTDILITTAQSSRGGKAPRLVTDAMLKQMPSGGVVIDIAAAAGGNVEGVVDGKIFCRNGLTIIGAGNLAAELPFSASVLFAGNIFNFLMPYYNREKARFDFDFNDEIVATICILRDGRICRKGKQ